MGSGGRAAELLPGLPIPRCCRCLASVDRVAIDDDAALLELAEDALGRSMRHGKFYSARASTIWQFIGLEMFWCGRFAGIDRILGRAIESAKPNDPTYVGWHQHLLAKTWLAFSYAQLGFSTRAARSQGNASTKPTRSPSCHISSSPSMPTTSSASTATMPMRSRPVRLGSKR